MRQFDFEERCVFAVAIALSVAWGLLSYAGFASRQHRDQADAYAAGWLAFWIVTVVVTFVLAGWLIQWNRDEKRKKAQGE